MYGRDGPPAHLTGTRNPPHHPGGTPFRGSYLTGPTRRTITEILEPAGQESLRDEHNRILLQIRADPVPSSENLARLQRMLAILGTYTAVTDELVAGLSSAGTADAARENAA